MKERRNSKCCKKINMLLNNLNIAKKIMLYLIIFLNIIAIINIKDIYAYYTCKETIDNTFTVESHTITYNYYIVSCSGNIVQVDRTETQKGYTGTSIILGSDASLMISDNNNTYYKMDFKIAGTTYEKDSEYIVPANDVTIEQYYYLTKYTVSFDTNSLVDPIPTREISDGENYGSLPNISKTGYTFYGWYKENTFENEVTAQTTFTELTDITLYAKILPNEYNIIFNSNGGTGDMQTQTFRYNETQNLTQNAFTKDGYTFTGWNLAADGSETSFTNREQILNMTETNGDEFTLYAQWRANDYTIAFDANGGILPEYNNETITTKQVTYDQPYGEMPTATKTGYSFDGWYLNNEQITQSTNVSTAQNHTLIAQYTPNTYTIAYDANNGTGNMTSTPATYDQSAQLTANAFTRTGYTFAGWNTIRDGSGSSYADEASVTNLTSVENGTATLYAQWTPNTYTISFNANTGTGTMNSQSATYDVQTTLTTNNFTKTGYTFAGWATSANGSVEYNDGESVSNLVSTNNGNINLYAVWTPNTNTEYTVIHYLMNTSGAYAVQDAVTEVLTGTSDTTIQLNNLIKTTPTYNVTNGIYYSRMTTGEKAPVVGQSINNEEVTGNIQNATTTIRPDGNLVISIYYARTYGYLTTVAGTNVTSVTAQTNEQYYYGQTVPQLTATMAYEPGYIKTFEKWASSNTTAIADILDNPIMNFTWPAMVEGTSITLTATATKEASTDTPYTVNYYLENANDTNYTLYTTRQLHGTTNDPITQQDVETTIANTTLYSTDLSTDPQNPTIIASDGSTVVNVYYNRNTFTLTVNGDANIAELEVSTTSTPNVDNTQPISIVDTYKYGATIDLDATLPTETGYTYAFTGWDTVSTANLGASHNPIVQSTTITMPAENLTLTATASKTANTYTVVFNPNGGTGTMADQSFTYGTAQNLTANSYTKSGYTFKGWATVTQGVVGTIVTYTNGESVSNLTATNNGIVNLYAIWEDETAPVLTLTNDTTTKSIQVTVTPTETGSGMAGTYKFYIGTMQTVEVEGTPTEQVVYGSPVEQAGASYTFTNLNSNTEYYVKVEALDNAGNLGTVTESITTDQLTGEVTFTNPQWSNGKYLTTVNTTARDENNSLYNIQYQVITAESAIQGTTFNSMAGWETQTITSGTRLGEGTLAQNGATNLANLVLKEGDTIYARVYDGVNGGPYYSYTVTNPAVKTYTEESLAAVPYGSSTFNILAYETSTTGFEVDIEKQISGVETYNYYAKSNDEDTYKLISTSTNWNDPADVSNAWLQMIGKDTLDTNQTYKVKVLTRAANGAVTQCLNTATMITQPNAVVNTTYAQNRTYIDSENYTAVIPAGFKVSNQDGTNANETDETTISSGMVLIDGNGNEFVWVPVNKAIAYDGHAGTIPTSLSNGNTYYKPMAIKQTDNTNSYESIVYAYGVSGGTMKSYRNTNAKIGVGKEQYREPSLLTGNDSDGYTWHVEDITGTGYDASSAYYHDVLGFDSAQEFGNYMNQEYQNMINSTNNFGGFYMGRYETSINGQVVQSKANQTPMSYMNWYQTYQNQDSIRNSSNPYYNVSSVTSSMMWGSQYDAMLNWIMNGTEKTKLQDNTSGNKTNAQTNTGIYESDKANNIYDLIANTLSWSQEAYGTNIRVYRGGSYVRSETANMTARGQTINVTAGGPGYGSRLTLYINTTTDTVAPRVSIVDTSSTANSVTIKALATDSGSGIAKYYYSIKGENDADWTTYLTDGNVYTISGLTANSTYSIKVQAEDRRGNLSNVEETEVELGTISLVTGDIYELSLVGSDGNGIMKLGVLAEYANQGYTIEYQVKVADSTTANSTNARYEQLTSNGTWLSGDTITGLYEGDRVYARLTDGVNKTSTLYFDVEGLEEFETYAEYTARVGAVENNNIYYVYTDPEGQTAKIPKDFSVGVSDTINTISNGLVIQDANGNQFVWVPVEKAIATSTSDYPTTYAGTGTTKPMAIAQSGANSNYYEGLLYDFNSNGTSRVTTSSGLRNYRLGNSSYSEPRLITGSADGYTWDLESLASIIGETLDNQLAYYGTRAEFSSGIEFGKYMNEEYKNMVESVQEYKGFYVGRYETSLNGTTVQSQLNTKPYDDTSKGWHDIYYYQDSNRYSSNPYSQSATVTSSMIWGSQYDAMLNWLLENNKDIMFTTTLGNHTSATTSSNSGQYIDDLANNIFDLGGNLREFTQEATGTGARVVRGGSFYKSSSYPGNYTMVSRGNLSPSNIGSAYNVYGSRMTLYLTKSGDITNPTISVRETPTESNGDVTTNSITFKVTASDPTQDENHEPLVSSGIEKYHYYISTDNTNFTEYIGWGNTYTFKGLSEGTTYYIKATVEDKAGNKSSEVTTSEPITTVEIPDIEDIITTTRFYGSDSTGHLYIEMDSTCENSGYRFQYQKVASANATPTANGWKDFKIGGKIVNSNTVIGLSAGDYVCVQAIDSYGNTSNYKTIPVTSSDLETFETYAQYTARVGAVTNNSIYYEYTDPEGSKAKIPKDFKVGSSNTINKISTGLVVEDADGNQYVWVPVPDAIAESTSDYPTAYSGGNVNKPMAILQSGSTENYEGLLYQFSGATSRIATSSNVRSWRLGASSYREPSLVTGTAEYTWAAKSGNNYDALSQYFQDVLGYVTYAELGQRMNAEYTNMVKSVNEYGGFYVGRFETTLTKNSSNVNGVVESKIDGTSMSSLEASGNRWYGEYYYQDSKLNDINPYHNSTTVTSSMIWGSQYDAMLNWIIKGTDSSMISIRTGNHSGSKAATGTWGVDVMNNIFDLSANQYEWTQEANSTSHRVRRGGSYYATDTTVASSRSNSLPTSQNAVYGSRLVLCIRSSESE